MAPASSIRNLHYTPSSYLDQKHQFVGYSNMKYYNTYNDEDMTASCNTEEKEQLDAFEDRLHEKSRQEERLSQVYNNMETLKRKQAYRSLLKGATLAPQDSLLPPDAMFHGLDHKYYDESDPSCPLSKVSFKHQENAEYKYNEEEDEEDDYGEQYKIRMLRSHRLKQVSLKTQDEVLFLEERERKRREAVEEKKRDALQEEKERLTLAQEREQLERERAAFEIMRRATLKKQREELLGRKKEAKKKRKEAEEISRSSIDGCKGCHVMFQEPDDISAADASIFPSEIQDLLDSISDACHKVIFCGGVMDPNETAAKNSKEGRIVPHEVMLSEEETLGDTLSAPTTGTMDDDDNTIEINLDAEEKRSEALA